MVYLYQLMDEEKVSEQYRFTLDEDSIEGKIYVTLYDSISKIYRDVELGKSDYSIKKREPNNPFFEDYRLVYTFDSKEHFLRDIKSIMPEYFI